MSTDSGPIQFIEPRGQTEVVLWSAALFIALAAHVALLSWWQEALPGIVPKPAPVETEVTVELIKMASQAAPPSAVEAARESASAAVPTTPPPEAATAPTPQSRTGQTAEPAPEATRITGTPLAPSAEPAPPPANAEQAETSRAARAETERAPQVATPARVAAAPVVTENVNRPEVATTARAATETPEIATATARDDRIIEGRDSGTERVRTRKEQEAVTAVQQTGEVQSATAPQATEESTTAEPEALASLAPTTAPTPPSPESAPERLAPRPEIPADMVPERVTAATPTAEHLAAAAPMVEPAPEQTPTELPGLSVGDSGAAAPAAPSSEISQQDRNRYAAILDYLKTYEGGPCFAALPALGEETQSLTLDAFGPTTASLDGFRTGLEAETGTIPGTYLKPVSEAQCATLAFIRRAPAYPAFNLYFDMPAREIASGEYLSGRILNVSGQVVHFLIIDDEGTVQALDSFLKFTRSGASFDIPMSLTAGPVVTQQLLLAIGTPARLATVTEQNGIAAASFFQSLENELKTKGISADLSMVAFSVQ